jgi:hypothetical protein
MASEALVHHPGKGEQDGRVVAEWTELDIFGLLQQIGAIPKA